MAVLTLENPVATTEELVEKLYRTKGKAEIVNGEVVEFMATGCEPGIAAGNIFFSLKIYQRQTKQGFAVGDNVGFLVNLPNRKSFSPEKKLSRCVSVWETPARNTRSKKSDSISP